VDSNGCPRDSDGDDLNDCEDNCPYNYGPASNNDNDGVPDTEDYCPF